MECGVTDTVVDIGRLLRIREVVLLTSLSQATIYRYIQNKTFPPPVKLGPGSVRWRSVDIDVWMQSLQSNKKTG